jgi:hypothetical protein
MYRAEQQSSTPFSTRQSPSSTGLLDVVRRPFIVASSVHEHVTYDPVDD